MQAGKNLSDHGLLFASLTASLLLTETAADRAWLAERLERASLPVDLGSLHQLLSVVRSVLAAQAVACGLAGKEVESLGRRVLEAWLLTLPEGEGQMGEVVVRVNEGGGAGEVAVAPGLLYRHEPTFGAGVERMEGVRVALYNVMLDHHQSGEEWEGLTLEVTGEAVSLDLVHQLEGLGVGLLLCQKVVGEEVRSRLETRLGMQVVDRLGTAAFSRAAAMVGGRVVSSAAHRLEPSDLGWVEVVEQVEVQGKSYLSLQRPGAVLVSLVVGSLGEDQAEELQASLAKAVAGLAELATEVVPRVVPGAGCLEALLALQAEGGLARALARLALLPSGLGMEEAWVDTRHGHLWGEEGEWCVCGLVGRSPGLELVPGMEALLGAAREVEPVVKMPVDRAVVVDSRAAKRRALLLALETAETLADIGTILYC